MSEEIEIAYRDVVEADGFALELTHYSCCESIFIRDAYHRECELRIPVAKALIPALERAIKHVEAQKGKE